MSKTALEKQTEAGNEIFGKVMMVIVIVGAAWGLIGLIAVKYFNLVW